ncbi:MAG TPA: aconitate hydratase [Anaerolineales bacterium]|jgi:aconitate hydratase|nr:aconitate hydratase [Anaerolineales bacterium]
MALNVSQKLIKSHLLEGEMVPGQMIGIRIDQTLTQDATGTLVMLELEAMGLRRAQTEVSVQYVDHNLIQADHKNADDHLFLQSACERYGIWYSRPGNGVSHPVHMQYFGKPGKTLLGSDSHTPAAGSLGMLAIGAGGLDVAMAIAGHPFYLTMPKIWGVQLTGKLPDWVSAKDIILEMLRRHTVKGGVGHIIEYYGPGLKELSAMDRHVIANMGTELGATSTVFPSDEEVRRFLRDHKRGEDWVELVPDAEATYDRSDEIDLSTLEPLIAMPNRPDAVVPVRELAGMPVYQSYIGSSANPGYRDFAIVAQMMKGRKVPGNVSLDINPTSRQLLEELVQEGEISHLLHAGGRLHQAGCNGCIGMGQAPATGKVSLRTVPRNFPGRSGTINDQVYLCSPETAAASALTGVITDPRELGIPYPNIKLPKKRILNKDLLVPPLSEEEATHVELVKGPNIQELPPMDRLPDRLEMPILLKVGDNISTDEIMPAGARVLPYRSNIPKISEFVFENIDPTYDRRALERTPPGSHAILAGDNYGQGSSREHAAIAPRYLGLRMVIAKSFARIHRMNLVNFGILPVIFSDPAIYDLLELNDVVVLENAREQLAGSVNARTLVLKVPKKKLTFNGTHNLFPRMIEVILAGGLTNWTRDNAPIEASTDLH